MNDTAGDLPGPADRESADDPEECYRSARAAALAGDQELAFAKLGRARELYALRGDGLLALRTELGRINVLADLSRSDECLAVARKLRADLAAIDTDGLDDDSRQLHAWLSAAAAENHGAALELAGRHTEAANSLENALTLYADIGSAADRARLQASLGVQALSTGSPQRALDALADARTRFGADDAALVQRCRVYEAQALAMMGRYRLALASLHAADYLAERVGVSDGPDQLRAQVTRSEVLLRLNLIPEVLDLCASLAPTLQASGMRREYATCRHIEARAWLATGQRDDAREACQTARETFEQAGLHVLAAHASVTLAQCIPDADTAIAEVEDALASLSATGERPWIAEAALVGADIARRQGPAAIDRRRRFVDNATSARASESPELAWREQWHRGELAGSHEAKADHLRNALRILTDLRADLDAAEHRVPFMAHRREPLEAMVDLLLTQGDHRGAFALSAAHRAASLVDFVEPVADDTSPTTLLYQAIADRLVCFVSGCGPTGTRMLEVIDLGAVAPHLDDLMIDLDAQWRHLADPRLRGHVEAFGPVIDRLLRRAHEMLVAPVQDLLPAGSLTIVPVGRVASVPFAALHDGTTSLLDTHTLSVSPRVPNVAHSDSHPGVRSTLAVGLPDSRAPHAGSEAERVAQMTQGDLLLSEAATADAVRSAAADAEVLHLAGHSRFRPDNPWLSSFVFADREVSAAELADWDLGGMTIVLASCLSARQSNFGEDELLGLPRALLHAGASDVLVNLWAVDDKSSVGQMVTLHEQLQSLRPADALHQAQLFGRMHNPHPYFWASMVHYLSPVVRPSRSAAGALLDRSDKK